MPDSLPASTTVMPPPLISVVIPSYRRRDSVIRLLDDVYRQEGVTFEVIVVDDCSPDDSATAIAAACPPATVLTNEKNGGPAVTRNRGIRAARGKYVVGFDSDVTVPDRAVLRKVAGTFERFPDATGLAFRLLAPDGQAEDKPRWWHPVPIESHAAARFFTHYFSGTGYAFRRAELLTAGLFPEILYMHYEEVELAFRILDNGGSIMHCPDIPVLHHEHQVSRRTEVKTFYKYRNQILVALACYPALRGVVYLLPRLGFGFVSAVLGGHLSAFVRALRSARELAPARLAERRPLKRETWQRITALRHA